MELAINRALELDPMARQKLASLNEQQFRLSCTAPELDIVVAPTAAGLSLFGFYEGEVTTTLRGELSDFSRLIGSNDPAGELINGNLELEGDSAPLIELQKIISGLDMDWEAPLVANLGDVAGHQIAQILRGAWVWGKQTGNSLNRQLEEFIHEEARIAPPALEMEDFFSDVTQLGQRVDRLNARLQRLRARIDSLTERTKK
jgi:ubiquinone biosynthesis protein UbiJ